MNEYYKSSDYYPDDKDIFDYLSATGASYPSMLDYLAESGILCSGKNRKDEIQDYLSYLYLSWPKAVKLLELVDTRESDEHLTTSELPVVTDMDSVRAAIEAVKKLRSDREREVYNLAFGTDEVEVSVTYIELDTSKTRVLQKRQREVKLWITVTKTNLCLRHTNNNHIANAIVESFLGKLAEGDKSKSESFKPQYISFDKITSNEAKVQFFKDMMNGIPGFDLKDVTNIRVGRTPKQNTGDEEEMDEGDVEDAVKKAVFYGTRLFATKEFQNLVSKGFFVTWATWRSEYQPDAPDQVEFTAGFSDPDSYKAFGFKIGGKFPSSEGIVQSTKVKVPPASVKDYTIRFEKSLRSAYQTAVAGTPKPPQ